MSSSSAISRGRAVPIPATSSSNASSTRLRRARSLSGVVLPSSERSRRGSLARFRFPSSRSKSSPATCAKASDGDDAKPKKTAPKKKKTAAKKEVDETAVEVEPTVDGEPAVVEPAAELTEEKKKKLAERSIDSALADHEDDWNDARASREPNASSDDATASSSARPEVSGEEEEDEEEAEVDAVKSRLLDSFYGTNRGLSASSKTRAEVNELISRLEAMNPTPSPSYELAALSGKWRLVYTSNSEVMFLLAAENLPGLNVGDITQTIDGVGGRVENRVAFSAPMLESSVSANASFEVRSPKRLQVKFDEAGVETPTIVADVFQYMSLPMTVDVMGQSIDTAPLADLMQPFQSGLTDALNGVKSAVSGLPSLKVPLPESASPGSEAWLLTTYLDGDLRIARGDGGSVFVLTKVSDPPKYGN